ncbi:MAG: DUF6133 family protein [Lachnospiraceae bacterium]|nr:DUF6133 family protein [Muribaculum sp.]MCM1409850.1 DUF6133 family protein [Lachnospiraceae bacterium]
MRKAIQTLKTKAACAVIRIRNILSSEAGDFYISDGVKIIIAVVLGALLLAALTLIFNDTVIPRITREIEGLFGP